MKAIGTKPGVDHILQFMPFFTHPKNGNTYFVSIEKRNIPGQDLVIYKLPLGSIDMVEVARWTGGVDSFSAFAAGGAVIDKQGTLLVGAATQVNQIKQTGTGFENGFGRRLNFEEPY